MRILHALALCTSVQSQSICSDKKMSLTAFALLTIIAYSAGIVSLALHIVQYALMRLLTITTDPRSNNSGDSGTACSNP